MAAVGAYYLLNSKHVDTGRLFVKLGVIAAFASSVLLLFPTGDAQGRNVAKYQPVTLAAMEGHFETRAGAPIALIGQPDVESPAEFWKAIKEFLL